MSQVSKSILWTGRVFTWLPGLFLLADGAGKIAKPAPVIEACIALGIPENVITPIGILLLFCTVLYLVPRTAVIGAMLVTAYLGGAVATHVRAGQGAFEILFPVVFGVLIWSGLGLRDPELRKKIFQGCRI